jgi:hypothetical protein
MHLARLNTYKNLQLIKSSSLISKIAAHCRIQYFGLLLERKAGDLKVRALDGHGRIEIKYGNEIKCRNDIKCRNEIDYI